MKVLFINTPTLDQPLARDMAGGLGFDRGEQVILPPLDLAYQAAALRAAGHGVDMVDPDAEGWGLHETLDRCRERQWDTAICAASLPSMKNDCRFIRTLRQETGRPILLHTNVTEPDAMRMMLENSGVEFGLFGECEILLDPILSNQTREATFRLTDGVLDSPGQPRVQDLDRLPFPARDLLPNDRYRYFLLVAGASVATVQTSRGCPFKCAYYCPYPLVQGKTWRARSADNVIEELREIRQGFGISNILFRDAVFTLDQNRSREICERMVTAGLSLRWWCETRADLLD